MNVLQPAQTEWGALIVSYPNKDGAIRSSVDYQKLNAVTVRDSYPLSRIDECIDLLRGARVFPTLDASLGYWKVEEHEEHGDKTAFKSHHKLYCFACMPFGLKKAMETFQRVLNVTVTTVK